MSSSSLSDVLLSYTPPGILADVTSRAVGGGRLSSRGVLGLEGAEGGSDALKAQKRLEEERRAQLAGEAAERAATKRRAETAGSRAGAGGARSTFLGGLGFGSGNTPSAPGRGNLFGN